MSKLKLTAKTEEWELKEPFTIARGTRTHVNLISVEIGDGEFLGKGETTPTPRYGESIESELQKIHDMAANIPNDITPQNLLDLMPNGGARNAVDAALWDYLAKKTGKPVWEMLGLGAPKPVETVFTISLDSPEKMAENARKNAFRGLLKLKFGGDGDDRRAALIREAVGPDCRMVLDANESWSQDHLKDYLPAMKAADILMVEQPLPQGKDDCLAEVDHVVPICADESCHTREGLTRLEKLYDMINIKLDKTGGLTEASLLLKESQKRGFEVMVGCMLGTSLGMAPSHLVASHAKFVDLDAPLLMKKDRVPGLRYEGNKVYPPTSDFWG